MDEIYHCGIKKSFGLVKSFYLQQLCFIVAVGFNLKPLALRGAPVRQCGPSPAAASPQCDSGRALKEYSTMAGVTLLRKSLQGLMRFILKVTGTTSDFTSVSEFTVPVQDGGARRVVLLGRRLGSAVDPHRLSGGSGECSSEPDRFAAGPSVQFTYRGGPNGAVLAC